MQDVDLKLRASRVALRLVNFVKLAGVVDRSPDVVDHALELADEIVSAHPPQFTDHLRFQVHGRSLVYQAFGQLPAVELQQT